MRAARRGRRFDAINRYAIFIDIVVFIMKKYFLIVIVLFGWVPFMCLAVNHLIPPLPGIPIGDGIVYRAMGEKEWMEILTGKSLFPVRLADGALTVKDRDCLFSKFTPEQSLRTINAHQIAVSALEYDVIIDKNYLFTDAGDILLIRNREAFAGGLVISGTTKLQVAEYFNLKPDYSGHGGPVLVLKMKYYKNVTPAISWEGEIFLPGINQSDVVGIYYKEKVYTVKEFLKLKGLTGKSAKEILKVLTEDVRVRYAAQKLGSSSLDDLVSHIDKMIAEAKEAKNMPNQIIKIAEEAKKAPDTIIKKTVRIAGKAVIVLGVYSTVKDGLIIWHSGGDDAEIARGVSGLINSIPVNILAMEEIAKMTRAVVPLLPKSAPLMRSIATMKNITATFTTKYAARFAFTKVVFRAIASRAVFFVSLVIDPVRQCAEYGIEAGKMESAMNDMKGSSAFCRSLTITQAQVEARRDGLETFINNPQLPDGQDKANLIHDHQKAVALLTDIQEGQRVCRATQEQIDELAAARAWIVTWLKDTRYCPASFVPVL